MNADTVFDAPLRRDPSVALDEARLHLNCASHCVNYAAELDDCTVAVRLTMRP
jgi:hypothetical protein